MPKEETWKDDVAFAKEWARENPPSGEYKKDRETTKFLDSSDEQRFLSMYCTPDTFHALNEADESVYANDYYRFLDRNRHSLYEDNWTRENESLVLKDLRKEQARRCREWNSKLDQISISDYIFPEKDGFRGLDNPEK